jgi:hypothetical protein
MPCFFLFVFYPCYPNGYSGEVAQRKMHLCSFVTVFLRLREMSVVLTLQSCPQNLILEWWSLASQEAHATLLAGRNNPGNSAHWTGSPLGFKYRHPYLSFLDMIRLRLLATKLKSTAVFACRLIGCQERPAHNWQVILIMFLKSRR